MLHSSQQRANRMGSRSGSEIFSRHMQIDLSAGDLPMAEQIADGDEAYALAHKVGRKCVAHAMR